MGAGNGSTDATDRSNALLATELGPDGEIRGRRGTALGASREAVDR